MISSTGIIFRDSTPIHLFLHTSDRQLKKITLEKNDLKLKKNRAPVEFSPKTLLNKAFRTQRKNEKISVLEGYLELEGEIMTILIEVMTSLIVEIAEFNVLK